NEIPVLDAASKWLPGQRRKRRTQCPEVSRRDWRDTATYLARNYPHIAKEPHHYRRIEHAKRPSQTLHAPRRARSQWAPACLPCPAEMQSWTPAPPPWQLELRTAPNGS